MIKSTDFYIANIGKTRDINLAIAKSKSELKINQINDYIDKLFKFPYLNRNKVLKNPFPKRIEELGSEQILISSGDSEKEIVWLSRILSKYQDEINEFIEKSNKFNKYFLLGQLKESEIILQEIEKEFGFSYWLIESKILLLQEMNGLEKHKEYVNKFLRNDNINILLKYFVGFISIKMEENLSYEKYNLRISELIQEESEISENLINYIKYKLYLRDLFKLDPLSIIYFESNFSIIDRYILLKKILKDINEYISPVSFNIVLNNLKGIRDYQSSRLLGLKGDQSLLDILDEYTKGNYDIVIEMCTSKLKYYPYLVDLYPIYVKSMLFMGNKFDNDEIKLNQLLKNLSEMYKNSTKFDESYANIKKLTYIFSQNDWAWQLRGLIETIKYTKNTNPFSIFYKKNVHPDNPIYITGIEDYTTQADFMELLYEKPDSITLKLYENIYEENIKEISLLDIPSYRKNNIIASLYMKQQKFCEANEIYNRLLKDDKELNVIEGIIGYVDSATKLGKYNEVINLIVDMYLYNNLLVKQIDLITILNNLNDDYESLEMMSNNIELPIIYGISNKFYSDEKESDMSEAYENFLESLNVTKPSELKDKQLEIDDKKLIYFLKNVCIESVMDYSIYFDSTEEIENERIAICQYLIEKDESNASIYSSEIREITQKQIINRGLREIEKSKIFVDVDGIKKALERDTKENFLRYKDLLKANVNDSAPVYITINDSIHDVAGQKIELRMPTDERRQLFNRIVFDLRDSFVSSNKHGLDGYLSVGIRHGTLAGQLRADMEDRRLITQKNSDTDIYQLSEIWKMKINEVSQEKKIEEILDKFGKSIDGLIDKLKNRWIQIKTEKGNHEGLFDFQMYIDELEELETLVKEDTSYDELMDILFSKFWKKTDESLQHVRNKIKNELKDEFNEVFEILLNDLDMVKNDIDVSTLKDNIINSRTNMQYELEKVSEWFTRNKSTYSSSFSAEVIIDIAYELTKNIFNNQNMKLNKNIENIKIMGNHLKSFVDLMFILFDNIIKHSKLNTEIVIDVKIKRSHDHLLIVCENDILNESITNDTIKKIDEIKQNISRKKRNGQDLSYVSKEGGSGFYKIDKIVTIDMNCDLEIDMQVVSNKFIVKLDIKTKGIFYENINN